MNQKIWDLYAPVYEKAMRLDRRYYQYMYDRIPNARWELFRTCRHMCFVENTEKYIAILKDWLNQND